MAAIKAVSGSPAKSFSASAALSPRTCRQRGSSHSIVAVPRRERTCCFLIRQHYYHGRRARVAARTIIRFVPQLGHSQLLFVRWRRETRGRGPADENVAGKRAILLPPLDTVKRCACNRACRTADMRRVRDFSHLLQLCVRDTSGHADLEHLARLQDPEALELVHHVPGAMEHKTTRQISREKRLPKPRRKNMPLFRSGR